VIRHILPARLDGPQRLPSRVFLHRTPAVLIRISRPVAAEVVGEDEALVLEPALDVTRARKVRGGDAEVGRVGRV
jgi:hypothetical protein